MAISHEDIISALDGLVATCRDGEEGFRAAAEAAQNAELRGLFLTYAQQRGDFRAELEDEIRRLGGTPSTRGSIAGALHRGWMSVRSSVGGGSDDSVVAEAERGEDAAKRAYQAALDRELPPTDPRHRRTSVCAHQGGPGSRAQPARARGVRTGVSRYRDS
jgi:uncharacterized protein (TIGR02284 family)